VGGAAARTGEFRLRRWGTGRVQGSKRITSITKQGGVGHVPEQGMDGGVRHLLRGDPTERPGTALVGKGGRGTENLKGSTGGRNKHPCCTPSPLGGGAD